MWCVALGDEFMRCGGDFGYEELDRRRMVCHQDETSDATFEGDSCELFGPLLWWSNERGASRSRELSRDIQEPAHSARITSHRGGTLIDMFVHLFKGKRSARQLWE